MKEQAGFQLELEGCLLSAGLLGRQCLQPLGGPGRPASGSHCCINFFSLSFFLCAVGRIARPAPVGSMHSIWAQDLLQRKPSTRLVWLAPLNAETPDLGTHLFLGRFT